MMMNNDNDDDNDNDNNDNNTNNNNNNKTQQKYAPIWWDILYYVSDIIIPNLDVCAGEGNLKK